MKLGLESADPREVRGFRFALRPEGARHRRALGGRCARAISSTSAAQPPPKPLRSKLSAEPYLPEEDQVAPEIVPVWFAGRVFNGRARALVKGVGGDGGLIGVCRNAAIGGGKERVQQDRERELR